MRHVKVQGKDIQDVKSLFVSLKFLSICKRAFIGLTRRYNSLFHIKSFFFIIFLIHFTHRIVPIIEFNGTNLKKKKRKIDMKYRTTFSYIPFSSKSILKIHSSTRALKRDLTDASV